MMRPDLIALLPYPPPSNAASKVVSRHVRACGLDSPSMAVERKQRSKGRRYVEGAHEVQDSKPENKICLCYCKANAFALTALRFLTKFHHDHSPLREPGYFSDKTQS